MNLYLNILFESAWTASIIPLGSEPTFFAMKSFGGYAMPMAALLATIGATAGQLFNWGVGLGLIRIGSRNQQNFSEARYGRLRSYFHRYGIFLLLFSWAPLMNLAVVAAGMFKIPLRIALPLILIGQAVHYGLYIL